LARANTVDGQHSQIVRKKHKREKYQGRGREEGRGRREEGKGRRGE